MGFQTSVTIYAGLGIPGELAFDGPMRATPANLFSSGTPNIIGNAFTWTANANPNTSAGSPDAGNAAVGGTGVFAGILMSPKEYSANGVTGNPLGASLVLPDYTIGELLYMGQIFVSLPGPANQGDLVTYDPATGNLNSIAPTVNFTGSIAPGGSAGVPDVLTVTVVANGTLAVGQQISGTGVDGNTYIISLGTGTGNTGTYNLSTVNLQTVTSRAMTAPNVPTPAWAASAAYITTSAGVDTLHITTLTSGQVLVGSTVNGVGVAANTVITALGSGTGGTGTYTLNSSGQTVASSGSPIAMTGPTEIIIPSAKVDRYGASSTGGVAAIRLTI